MKFTVFLISCFFSTLLLAEEFLPINILMLDEKFSHHVILVEKSSHKLFIYQNNQTNPHLLKTYQVATGKIRGNKYAQGDHKTPEGIYQFQLFHSGEELKNRYGEYGNIYGAGAFTMNYPNLLDRRMRKTGGGIWLHSTDDASRISKGLDSRGCVVTNDEDLKDISNYLDLNNSSIIVVENVYFVKKSTWEKQREAIWKVVDTWADAWKTKKFDIYIDQYSKAEFQDRRGGFNNYRAYKKAIFSRNETPEIHFSHFSILVHNDYAQVAMRQDYNSELVQDVGKKILHLKRDDNYDWKIIAEEFKNIKEEGNTYFTPSMRFFQTANKE